ncbi:MAG TPA: M13 family metallopeptidase [Bacteroidales bacterium]|nr:M13 family metallopeptidase [Bacteroidales bacterium]HPS16902.1 M13 family metallopeptidase [Bacteroidales bacterium]
MKSKSTIKLIALLILSFSIMTGCSKRNKKKDDKEKVPAIDLTNLDQTIKPGADFFKYANGGWLKKNPIPEEYSRYGAFEVLQEKNYNDLKSILEDASKNKNAEKNSNEKKIGNFYASGMDSAKINKDGIAPLNDEFAKIDAIKTKDELTKEVAHLHEIGLGPLFYVYAGQDEKNSEMVIAQLYQGGLGMSDRDYYLEDDARCKEIRSEYEKYVTKIFKLMNDDDKTAKENASTILSLETKIAKASWTRLDLRDPVKGYNKMSVADLQKKCPEIKWDEYFAAIGLKNPGDINVGQPSFFVDLAKIIKNENINVWKTYLRWNLVNGSAGYLSSDFEQASFDFYSKVMSGKTKMQPRWKRVLNATNGALGEAVGQIYVKKYFPPEAKTSMLELVNNLKLSLRDRISVLTWMGAATKEKALAKLDAMNVKIGYPDKWRDYSKLEVTTDSYVMNALNAEKFNFEFQMSKVNKPVDRDEWHMNPQTVNAYYSPNMNEIVFPAAILQPPFFNKDADAAVNYGAIGAVIGHEMTHGFDDQGRQYDKKGNLTDWWTKDDAAKFTKQTSVLIEQYDAFKILDSLHVDGKLTIGENIADVGGVTVALNALKKVMQEKNDTAKIDGFTQEQRFFLSYAAVWRTNIRDKEQMRRLKEDVHSPAIARVNATLRNIPDFYNAFSVSENDALYLAPDKRAKIW